jgi:signal transduction histidine kinase
MILLALNLAVLMLPLAGLVFARIYENQLLRETEGELIAQAAVLGPALKRAIESRLGGGYGRPVEHAPGDGVDEIFTPVHPRVDLARDAVLPRRPGPVPLDAPGDDRMLAAGEEIAGLFRQVQKVTLAGLRILDPDGRVIGGSAEVGQSLGHLPEIIAAQSGRYQSVLRARETSSPQPAITSISRGAHVRVFVAYPVVEAGKLLGILYLSRTPDNIWRRLYEARQPLLVAALVVIGLAVTLVLITTRTILGPVDTLIAQAEHIAGGRLSPIPPLERAGTREIARLADSVADMAQALSRRSRYIQDFAVHVSHEFKSPLTSMRGAIELMSEHLDAMSEVDRKRFLDNLRGDTDRLGALVARLHDLAMAESLAAAEGNADVWEVLERVAVCEPGREIVLAGKEGNGRRNRVMVNMPAEALQIVASNLIANSWQAGASRVDIDVFADGSASKIAFADNGAGIAPGNRDRIFEPFFTTHRDTGGTGLGLRIAASLVEAHHGRIILGDNSGQGAEFIIALPIAPACLRRQI